MVNKKLLCAASLVALSISSNALAAQGDMYVSAQGGFVMTDEHDFNYNSANQVSTELDDGYAFGINAGYDHGLLTHNIGLRTELEYTYRNNEVDTHSINGASPSAGATGEVTSNAFMANAIAYAETNTPIKPYIGGGLGFAMVEYEGYGVSAIPAVLDDDDTVFAYQGILGAEYEITEEFSLTGDYRYFKTTDPDVTSAVNFSTSTEYENHNFIFGARYKF
jgi:opacity protein-like surface antigen